MFDVWRFRHLAVGAYFTFEGRTMVKTSERFGVDAGLFDRQEPKPYIRINFYERVTPLDRPPRRIPRGNVRVSASDNTRP